MMWIVLVLITVASMAAAGRMARARRRSAKAWLWVAAIIGPLGPLALYVLGDRADGEGEVGREVKPQS
jgi:hypothetical protein